MVIDAAHDAKAIRTPSATGNVVAVVCTHGHNDHITVAPQLGKDFDAPVLLNPADEMLWRMTHRDKQFRAHRGRRRCSRPTALELHAIATPGHSPGSTCLYAPALSARCSAATPCSRAGRVRPGRSFSDFPTILALDQGEAGQAARPTPSSTPATATPPASATNWSTTTNGWRGATNCPRSASALDCCLCQRRTRCRRRPPPHPTGFSIR